MDHQHRFDTVVWLEGGGADADGPPPYALCYAVARGPPSWVELQSFRPDPGCFLEGPPGVKKKKYQATLHFAAGAGSALPRSQQFLRKAVVDVDGEEQCFYRFR